MNHTPRSDEAPSEFDVRDLVRLRHLGHDAGAMLAAIAEHLRLVPTEGLEDGARRHLDAARLQCRALSRLIARTEAHLSGGPGDDEAAEFEGLGRDLKLAFADLAWQKGASLNVTVDPALSGQPGVGRIAAERIALNLIGNAIGHSNARRIEVEIGMADAAHLSLKVRDDGAGFPEYTLPAEGAIETPPVSPPVLSALGQGLGLGTVATVVEELGGRWGLANRAGGGAEVWVELPFAGRPHPAAATPAPADAAHPLADKRILVADDSEAVRAEIVAALHAQGAEAEPLRSGAEALDAIGRQHYDLVIVDSTMAGASGAQVIRGLRSQPGTAGQTPALAMAADPSVDRHDELIAAGADRVVTKPLPEPDALLRIVGRMLRAEHRTPAPAMAPATAPATAPAPAPDATLPLFDPEPLRRVCALAGPEMAAEIVDRLIADLSDTGARLRRAASPPDIVELRAASHVLVALAGTAGAMQLLASTQALSRMLHGEAPDTVAGLGPLLAEIGLLTEGAIAAIRRLPPPTQVKAAP